MLRRLGPRSWALDLLWGREPNRLLRLANHRMLTRFGFALVCWSSCRRLCFAADFGNARGQHLARRHLIRPGGRAGDSGLSVRSTSGLNLASESRANFCENCRVTRRPPPPTSACRSAAAMAGRCPNDSRHPLPHFRDVRVGRNGGFRCRRCRHRRSRGRWRAGGTPRGRDSASAGPRRERACPGQPPLQLPKPIEQIPRGAWASALHRSTRRHFQYEARRLRSGRILPPRRAQRSKERDAKPCPPLPASALSRPPSSAVASIKSSGIGHPARIQLSCRKP